ncbi:hypothetical protein [Emergencia sp. 1XD21-10]|uniref:hypothetical protein n=1 Tax=Emergencia sp. 1XD21-10 TaxID=2304569 RepID=UPI0013798060|nr:hypothetical protein [Emergencia sp. 1XD21-10]NCE98096.1 hypothetical protein [Emergencia sp. 1XD21-10]
MISYCIKQIDARTYSYLKAEAKRKKVSINVLINSILDSHANKNSIENIDNKYRDFVDDIVKLYRLDHEDFQMLMQRLVSVLEELQQTIEH